MQKHFKQPKTKRVSRLVYWSPCLIAMMTIFIAIDQFEVSFRGLLSDEKASPHAAPASNNVEKKVPCEPEQTFPLPFVGKNWGLFALYVFCTFYIFLGDLLFFLRQVKGLTIYAKNKARNSNHKF